MNSNPVPQSQVCRLIAHAPLASLLLSSLLLAAGAAHAEPAVTAVGAPSESAARPHANGEHPAVLIARRGSARAIDSNTFLVQPPASVTWTLGPVAEPTLRLADGRAAAAPAASQ